MLLESPRRLPGRLQLWLRQRNRTAPVRRAVVGPVGVTRIRRRRSRDLTSCARLFRRAFFEGQFPGVRPDAVRTWLDGDDVVGAWVAEREGEVVGHVAISRIGLDPVSALRWRETTGHEPAELEAVSRLCVRPSFRSQGIGAALVAAAVDDVRGRGLVPVLEVATTTPTAPTYARGHGWLLRASDPCKGRRTGLWIHRLEAASTP
jgi:GNAT superfamily N-acetyltransferase